MGKAHDDVAKGPEAVAVDQLQSACALENLRCVGLVAVIEEQGHGGKRSSRPFEGGGNLDHSDRCLEGRQSLVDGDGEELQQCRMLIRSLCEKGRQKARPFFCGERCGRFEPDR